MTQWYAIFEAGTTPANSDPVSTGTVIDNDDLTAQGRTFVLLPGDPTGLVWNRSTQAFGPAPARPNPSKISSYSFAKRFTAAEYFSIAQSRDQEVQQFMLELQLAPRGLVDLTNADLQAGLTYLVSKNLLTQARATAIGTP